MAPAEEPKRNARRKQTCKACGQHAALFWVNGRVKADPDHDLCPRCARRALNRLRAQQLEAA
ncbi:MAG TPA: hypothetical protein PK668_18805 [Myxococcota bacterium]|nr:hypothetical protein [Myxococcota bacterium]HRY96603.1 hypothetical protein [Myxococcota bacterium]